MSFDGIVTYAVKEELHSIINNGKISKIYQPNKMEILLNIRSNGKNYQLLLSSHPSFARVHISKYHYENPTEPPMFCMLLRKHLDGAVIEEISQVDFERIIIFTIRSKNEIGDYSYKKLIVEVMGRHSNIILIDAEKNNIIDSIKHIPPSLSRHRTILPGHEYALPPSQGKQNPFETTEQDVLKRLDSNKGKLDKQIINAFSGISPLFGKELVFRTGLGHPKKLAQVFLNMINQVKNNQFEPMMITTKEKEYFYILPLTHLFGETKTFSTISQLLDRFFYGKAERDRVKQQANDLERFIKNEISKNEKKIKKLDMTLKDAEKADEFKLYGELLTANLYAVKKGDKNIEVINYYDEDGGSITIELNPRKSPSENAQYYFSRYQKLKNSITIVNEQKVKTINEIEYFERLLQQIESAAPKDIEEMREELENEGYLKRVKKQANKKTKKQKPHLEKFISSDGMEILVGKNNMQNEYLTMKLANKNEIWLHTKDIPGSHVLIRHDNPSKEALVEAATIAAYYSKAKESSSVPVDYTAIKHVKKPNGAKPGYVIYDNQTTLFVTPSIDLVLRLKNRS